MNLNQLQYFKILAQEEHYTRAAQMLSITQPSLSHAIAQLEEELGTRLFEKKGLRGRAFLQNVGKIKIHAQCVDFYLGEYYEEKRNKRKCQKVSFIGPKGPACWPLPAQKQENCWSAPPALPVFRPQKRANSCSIFRKRTDEEKI